MTGLRTAWFAALFAAAGAGAADVETLGLDAQIDRLKHPLWTARRDAAESIAGYGAAGRDATPALLGALDDTEVRVRRAAVPALAAVGPTSDAALAGLIRALADPDWAVRREAALALAGAGSPAAV
ncbi:MAG: HEAT repeat domain-containing protein, partial [Woeseiaceae bacterium]